MWNFVVKKKQQFPLEKLLQKTLNQPYPDSKPPPPLTLACSFCAYPFGNQMTWQSPVLEGDKNLLFTSYWTGWYQMGWKTTQYPAAKTTVPFTNSFTGFLPSSSDLCTAPCLNLLCCFAFNLPICTLQASPGPAIPSFPRCWHCALLPWPAHPINAFPSSPQSQLLWEVFQL